MHQNGDALGQCGNARCSRLLDRRDGALRATLQRIPGSDVFGGLPRAARTFDYQLVDWKPAPDHNTALTQVLEDAYRFPFVLREMDVWLLGEGSHQRPSKYLGAHLTQMLTVSPACSFAVWAPNAKRVSVVGSFNQWDGRRHPMRLRRECGVWEIFVPGVGAGRPVQVRDSVAPMATSCSRPTPLPFARELRPGTASIVQGLPPRQSHAAGAGAGKRL